MLLKLLFRKRLNKLLVGRLLGKRYVQWIKWHVIVKWNRQIESGAVDLYDLWVCAHKSAVICREAITIELKTKILY